MKVTCLPIFFLFSFFLSVTTFSQSSTLEIPKSQKESPSKDLPDARFNRVMIIPFEEKMYMSEADKEISEKTGKSQFEIREIFRKGICNNVFIEAKMVHNSMYKSLSMHSEDPEIINDLDYIYKSIGYKYTPVHITPDTSRPSAINSIQKASDKMQEVFDGKKTDHSKSYSATGEPGTKIKEGQISSTPEKSEKFMNTSIVNPEALSYLCSKYECDFFVFINQMDLLVPQNTDYRDLSSDDYARLIKIHYTILYKNGKEIYGDAAKTYFSSRTNDAQSIVNSHFPGLAKEIVSHLENQDNQIPKNEQKKSKQHKSSFDDY